MIKQEIVEIHGKLFQVKRKFPEYRINLEKGDVADLKLFFEKTGVPMLLNTSFNDREPICETPEHALDCFLRTEIDYLYFADVNILVSKKKA